LADDLAHAEAPVRMQAAQSLQTIGREAAAARLPLQKALADKDKFVRYYAADALGALGSREAVPSLVAALGDQDLDVRAQAASAIHRLGDLEVLRRRALPALIEPLARQSDFGLYHVLRIIGEIGPAARPTVPALRDLLKRAEPSMKPYVAEALGGIGPRAREAVPDLLPLVASADARTAQATVAALGRIDDRAAPVVGALLSRMKDGPEEVRLAAMMVLHRWRAPDALRHIESAQVPALVKRLGSSDRDTRRDAAWRLHQWGGESAAAVPSLTVALSDSDQWVRQHAALALGAIGPAAAAAVPGLIRLLPDATARVTAASALGEIGPAAAPAVPSLLPLLDDADVAMTCTAAQTLRQIGTTESRAAFDTFAAREVPRLARQLADREQPDHAEAARHLVLLAPASRDALAVLVRAVENDPDWLARTKAAEALGSLGLLADEAVPALAAALDDGSSWVREAAAAALEDVGSARAREVLARFTSPQ
jgi:HEAT repeat protein